MRVIDSADAIDNKVSVTASAMFDRIEIATTSFAHSI